MTKTRPNHPDVTNFGNFKGGLIAVKECASLQSREAILLSELERTASELFTSSLEPKASVKTVSDAKRHRAKSLLLLSDDNNIHITFILELT